ISSPPATASTMASSKPVMLASRSKVLRRITYYPFRFPSGRGRARPGFWLQVNSCRLVPVQDAPG
ncbi:MAG: hypothetical protein ACM3ML_06135, partial [Micromonosporaceae bacterium]